MSILFLTAFDWTGTGSDLDRKFDSIYASSIWGSNGRWGGNAMVLSGGLGAWVQKLITGDQDTITVGFAIKIQSQTTDFLRFEDASGVQVQLRVSSDGSLTVYRNSTELDTSDTGIINFGSWYYLQMKVYIHDSAGTVEVRLDDTIVFNLTSQDTKEYSDYITKITWRVGGTANMMYNDMYITDGEFLGDIRIRTFFPNSDETYQMFDRSAGSDNYALVDETDPDDDSTYVESMTLNAKDSFGITPAIGGPVKAIQLNTMVRRTGTTTVKMKNLIRSGGSDYNSTEEETLSVGYKVFRSIHEVDPDDSNVWNLTKLSNSEFGYEITAISTTTTTV